MDLIFKFGNSVVSCYFHFTSFSSISSENWLIKKYT